MKFFPRAKDLNCERSKGTNVSITEVYYLVMYIISQVRVRRTSPVRNYLRLHGAYVRGQDFLNGPKIVSE
jgi:hypothetical protein